tara:strand:- start:6222 stop:6491 length:270 start_codon:yes stop_codon:yes gene_type:complete
MEFNQFKYSKKHDTYRTLVNVYNFKREDLEVYVRSDYKIVVTDYLSEEIIIVPERVKIEKIICHFVNKEETILMIELKLKDLEIEVVFE